MQISASRYRDRNTVDTGPANVAGVRATASGLFLPPSVSGAGGWYAGWPDATTTGYTGTLTDYTGPMTITTANTAISNKHISGKLNIAATGVTITNCLLTDGMYWCIEVQSGDVTVTDSEIVGVNGGSGCVVVTSGVFHGLRLNIWGSADGARLNADNCSLRDSFIHDPRGNDNPDPQIGDHYDNVTMEYGAKGVVLDHCTVDLPKPGTSCLTVGDGTYLGNGTFTNNWFAGGGWTLIIGPGDATGYHFSGNRFSTKYNVNCGGFGPVNHTTGTTNVTWTDNLWLDGPNAGTAVSS